MLLRREWREEFRPSFVARVLKTVDPGAEFKDNWHIGLLCEYLQAVYDREILRLLINIPVRSLKSVIASVAWTAWVLGRDPSERILTTSYSASLSDKHSVDARTVMRSPWYRAVFPDTVISRDQDQKTKFSTTAMGYRIATSVGGTATGEGGRILLMDDPINPKQALSDKERKGANTWIDQTFMSRADDAKTTAIVGVMQRTHTDDVTGHLMAKEAGWQLVKIPQENKDTRPLIFDFGRIHKTMAPGDLMHPKRNGPVEVKQFHKDLGSYAYAGQHLQEPVPLEGAMFSVDWFEVVDYVPAGARQLRYWDLAATAKKIAAHTSGCKMSEKDGIYYIEDIRRDQATPYKVQRLVKNTATQDGQHVPVWMEQEPGSGGVNTIDHYARVVLNGFVFYGDKKIIDKIAGAMGLSAAAEAGNVKLLRGKWNQDFLDEIGVFPNGSDKDQADSASGAYRALFGDVASQSWSAANVMMTGERATSAGMDI